MRTYWYHPESNSWFWEDDDGALQSHAEQGCDLVTEREYFTYNPRPKMETLLIDFETYWANNYSLSMKNPMPNGVMMTTQQYIEHEDFHVHGAGIKRGDRPSVWVPGPLLPQVFKSLDIPNHAVVGHNLHFDASILAWKYGWYPRLYIDTLALSRALLGQHLSSHALEKVSEKLLGLTKFPGFLMETKGVRSLPEAMMARLAKYCIGPVEGTHAGDTELTYAVLKRLLPHMPKDELRVQDWTIRIFTDPKVYLDSDMLWEYYAEVQRNKQRALEKAGLTSRDLLMSNDRYAAALEALGVTVPMKWREPSKKYPEGRMTFAFAKTDPEHKELLEHDDPDVQALVAARLEVKSTIEETRSLKYAQAADLGKRWPIHLNASGAKNTHRFSGGAGGGGNPQNWKRGGTIRDSIYCEEGKVFVVPDLSQIEARITLWLGAHMPDAHMEWEALEKLRNGEDIYGWFGGHIYGFPIFKSTHPYERQVSKSGVLGLGFGMGDPRLIEYAKSQGVMDMTPELAMRIKLLYRDMFRGVKQFWKVCDKQLLPALLENYECVLPNEQNPIIRADRDILGSPAILVPGGLHIKYPKLRRGSQVGWTYTDGNRETKLFGGKVTENIVQCLAGRILREILLEVHEPGFIDVWTNVHDEAPAIIDETPEIKEYIRIKEYNKTVPKDQQIKNPLPMPPAVQRIAAAMTKEVPYMPGLPLAMEYDFGYRYGDCK